MNPICPVCQKETYLLSGGFHCTVELHHRYAEYKDDVWLSYKGLTVWRPVDRHADGTYAYIRHSIGNVSSDPIKEYKDYLPSWEELIEQVKLLSLFS